MEVNTFAARARALVTMAFICAAFLSSHSLLGVGSDSGRATAMTRMFHIEWGEGSGKFRYQESALGFEADIFPRKYVRDRQGNFYFLEPGPSPRLSKFSSTGELSNTVDLPSLFTTLTRKDVVTPQELFIQPDGSIAALLRVFLKAEKREEIHLAHFNSTGELTNLVHYPQFKTASFQLDNSSFLDNDGYLWVLNDGGVCDLYGPKGDLVRSFAPGGSYVDSDGRLYIGLNPLKLQSRSGETVAQLLLEGHFSPGEPEEIDGAIANGILFSWKHLEQIHQETVTTIPRSIDLYRPDVTRRKLAHVGTVTLPANKYRNPNPSSDYVERTELYENRLAFDESGNVYFLGRSSKECWIEKVSLGIR
jgi:hypothetical protein